MFPSIPAGWSPKWESFYADRRKVECFAQSMGIVSLYDKESVRKVFVAWVREAMAGKKEEKYPYVLWYYLDVCSHIYGIDGFSSGYLRGWDAGVGKFLREGLTEEEFAFVTKKKVTEKE